MIYERLIAVLEEAGVVVTDDMRERVEDLARVVEEAPAPIEVEA